MHTHKHNSEPTVECYGCCHAHVRIVIPNAFSECTVRVYKPEKIIDKVLPDDGLKLLLFGCNDSVRRALHMRRLMMMMMSRMLIGTDPHKTTVPRHLITLTRTTL